MTEDKRNGVGKSVRETKCKEC